MVVLISSNETLVVWLIKQPLGKDKSKDFSDPNTQTSWFPSLKLVGAANVLSSHTLITYLATIFLNPFPSDLYTPFDGFAALSRS